MDDWSVFLFLLLLLPRRRPHRWIPQRLDRCSPVAFVVVPTVTDSKYKRTIKIDEKHDGCQMASDDPVAVGGHRDRLVRLGI